jgi:hypothetical protein
LGVVAQVAVMLYKDQQAAFHCLILFRLLVVVAVDILAMDQAATEVQEVEVALGDQLGQVIHRVPHLVKVITAAPGLPHQIMVVVVEEELVQ